MAVIIKFGEGEGERRYVVAPLKLRQLRLVAPYVEQMNDVAKKIDEAMKAAVAQGKPDTEGQNLEDLFTLSRLLCEIIAIAISKTNPEVNADMLEDEIDLSFLDSLQTAVRALLQEAGLSSKPGGKKAPLPTPGATGPQPEPEASAISSEELSAS